MPHARILVAALLLLTGLLVLPVSAQDTETEDVTPETVTPEAVEETIEEATEEATEAPDEETEAATEEATEAADDEPDANDSGPSAYTVVAGDTLFSIARRFGVSVTELAAANNIVNPNLIYVGQTLSVDGSAPVETPAEETPTPAPTEDATPESDADAGDSGTYTIVRGDTLFSIAIANGTTVVALSEANNITNPNLIFVGQTLTIPGGGGDAASSAATPEPATEAPSDDPTEAPPTDETENTAGATAPGASFAYGIRVFADANSATNVATLVNALGTTWARIDVDWRVLEPTPGQINFADLDAAINALDAQGTNILLTVTNAPDWARPIAVQIANDPNTSAVDNALRENGPPEDLATFDSFLTTLATRYAGRVDAYEIWTEPNLRRNWRNSEAPRLSDTNYIDMLTGAAAAIRTSDPNAQVISAGLAPTGFNDGANAISDLVFLAELHRQGLADVADGIGVHVGGWANPPDARAGSQPAGVESHYEDASFFMLDRLEAYREILVDADNAGTALWVTKFGWGTSADIPDGLDDPASLEPTNSLSQFVFFNYVDLEEQATYIPRAFELGRQLGYVGPMFLNNLNACPDTVTGDRAPTDCYYSIIAPQNIARPAFTALQSADKS